MLSLTTPQWQERFTRHFLACFDSYSWELRNSAGKNIPHMEMYIEKRQDTGGMRLMLDYIDLTEHVNLPIEVYENSLLQALMRITNNAICWSNDIISLEKEMARGEPNNLVLVMQQEYNCSLQEAVQLINEMITKEVKLFTKLSPLMLDAFPDYKQELQKYVAVMQSWIRGNLDWSFETRRYSDIEQITPDRHLSYLEAILPPMSQPDQRTAEGNVHGT
jgi:5-epi-alpha-selinene synthase